MARFSTAKILQAGLHEPATELHWRRLLGQPTNERSLGLEGGDDGRLLQLWGWIVCRVSCRSHCLARPCASFDSLARE